jgi:hypothetical protein
MAKGDDHFREQSESSVDDCPGVDLCEESLRSRKAVDCCGRIWVRYVSVLGRSVRVE